MAFLNLFKAGASNLKNSTEAGIINLLEMMDCGNINDEADLRDKMDALDKVSKMAVKAKAALDKESKEYFDLKKEYDAIVSDAGRISDGLESGQISGDKFQNHLNSLLEQAEQMQPRLDQEKQDMDEAAQDYKQLQELVEIKSKQLTTAKQTIGKARQDAQRLQNENERLKEKEKQQLVIAGLMKETDNASKIADAIGSKNDKLRQEVEARKMKIDALKNANDSGKSGAVDADVAAFLGTGSSSAPAKSAADRLAALRNK